MIDDGSTHKSTEIAIESSHIPLSLSWPISLIKSKIEIDYLKELRKKKFNSSKIRAQYLPNLELGFEKYISNFSLLFVCRKYDVKCLLLTQPHSLDHINFDNGDFFCFGWTKRKEFQRGF